MTVYLDNARSTPIAPEARAAMEPYITEKYGSPAAIYTKALEANEGMENAQATIAKILGANRDEIVFTSGGTEANNLALIGTLLANKTRGKHAVISEVEHPSILKTTAYLERHGWEFTYTPVDSNGIAVVDKILDAVREDTVLVSLTTVNDITGATQPIKEVGRRLAELDNRPYFHTDAVEAFTKIPLDVSDLGVDLMTLSSHKIHGPHGAGALYVKKGTRIDPIIHGGMTVNSLRADIEDIPAIVGFGAAAKLGHERMEKDRAHVSALQKMLYDGLVNAVDGVQLNGPPVGSNQRSPYNLNVTFDMLEGESVTLMLDTEDIAVATGSACASQILKPNYVILAMGKKAEDAHGSIRFTFSRYNTKEDVETVLEKLPSIVERLRSFSTAKHLKEA